jgi:MFS family permease
MFSSVPILVFSLVLIPIQLEMSWSRGAVSFAPFLFYLVGGLGAFGAGRFLERVGARLALVFFLSVAVISCFLFGSVTQLWQLYLVYGFLFPASSAGVILVVISVLISNWFTDRRGIVFGTVSTGFSFGQLLLVPAFSLALTAYGWRDVFVPLGAVFAIIAVVAAVVVKNEPPGDTRASQPVEKKGSGRNSAIMQTKQALKTSTFWLVAVSYAACGFTDYLITTHLASFASDQGFFPQAGAYALAIMGGANVIGLVLTGRASDIFGPAISLAFTYLVRLLSIPILLVTRDVYTLYVFSFLFGLTYFTTAPLTANLVRQVFGQERMGSIFGALGLVHSVAGGPGAYVGGLAYDITGSYSVPFSIGFAILLTGTVSAFVATRRTSFKRGVGPSDGRSIGSDRGLSITIRSRKGPQA